MVADRLDKLHARFPGCRILAFADLTTQMVLVTNSGCAAQRETLDAVCAEAAQTFGSYDRPGFGLSPAGTAIIATPDQLRIYLRDTSDPADGLCCVCDHTIAVDEFVQQARACLDQIAQGA